MRIAIANVYDDVNLGGAALTIRAIQIARTIAPSADISLLPVSASPQLGLTLAYEPRARVVQLPHHPGWLVGGLFAASAAGLKVGKRAMSSFDLVLSKGGYMFGSRSRRRLPGFLSASRPLWLAQSAGVPSIVLPTSIGPFSSAVHRWIVRKILSRSAYVAARDQASVQHAANLGVHAPVHYDLALSLPLNLKPPSSLSGLLTLAARQPASASSLSHVAGALIRAGYVSEVAILEQGPDRTVSILLAQKLKALGIPAQVFLQPLSLSSALEVYQNSSLVITERLHGAIFSLLAGVPSIYVPVDPSKESMIATHELPIAVAEHQHLATTAKNTLAAGPSEFLQARQAVLTAARADSQRLVSSIRDLLFGLPA